MKPCVGHRKTSVSRIHFVRFEIATDLKHGIRARLNLEENVSCCIGLSVAYWLYNSELDLEMFGITSMPGILNGF